MEGGLQAGAIQGGIADIPIATQRNKIRSRRQVPNPLQLSCYITRLNTIVCVSVRACVRARVRVRILYVGVCSCVNARVHEPVHVRRG